ncbi:MAG: hypothetical protein HUU47_10245 [Bacteroidetes bacterium]|nr:hypothetical protein [Bacteroidota bacterium]
MKKVLIILALTLSGNHVFSQSNFGIGLTLFWGESKKQNFVDSFGIKNNLNRYTSGAGITGAFKKNIIKLKSSIPSSFAIDIPVTIGTTEVYNLYTDLGLIFQYQIGALASEDTEYKKGFFVGTGLSYLITTWYPRVTGTNQVSTIKSKMLNPVFEVGFRIDPENFNGIGSLKYNIRRLNNFDGKPLIHECAIVYYF